MNADTDSFSGSPARGTFKFHDFSNGEFSSRRSGREKRVSTLDASSESGHCKSSLDAWAGSLSLRRGTTIDSIPHSARDFAMTYSIHASRQWRIFESLIFNLCLIESGMKKLSETFCGTIPSFISARIICACGAQKISIQSKRATLRDDFAGGIFIFSAASIIISTASETENPLKLPFSAAISSRQSCKKSAALFATSAGSSNSTPNFISANSRLKRIDNPSAGFSADNTSSRKPFNILKTSAANAYFPFLDARAKADFEESKAVSSNKLSTAASISPIPQFARVDKYSPMHGLRSRTAKVLYESS